MCQTLLLTHLRLSSGSRIRTNDLRVMSPTSYLCSIPHCCFNVAKLHIFFGSTKYFLSLLHINIETNMNIKYLERTLFSFHTLALDYKIYLFGSRKGVFAPRNIQTKQLIQ